MKRAFTLAEVLITLTIIGIIAVLTIPNLMAKYEKEQTATKLKKLYNTLSQAYSLSVLDNGPVEEWDISNKNDIDKYLNKYIIPYLKVEKNCGKNTSECTHVNRVTLTGKSSAFISPLAHMSSQDSPYSAFSTFRLHDGTILWAYYSPDGGIILSADINGDAKPNTMGKDTFWFNYSFLNISENKMNKWHIGKPGFYFWGENNTRTFLKSVSQDSCSKQAPLVAGASCGALIKLDGWEIKDDYPW